MLLQGLNQKFNKFICHSIYIMIYKYYKYFIWKIRLYLFIVYVLLKKKLNEFLIECQKIYQPINI
jgi:hypothetical protein